MENKDKLGIEIKNIMEEESFDLTLSQKAVNNIIMHRKKTLTEKLKDFLNREIEIPLAPAIIGVVVLFALILIPKDVFKSQNEKVIDMGGSYVIIRGEVGKNEN
jgi:uncharacterized phage-like protein YoqJ